MLTEMGGGAMVSVALAVFVASAADVAVIVTDAAEAGAV